MTLERASRVKRGYEQSESIFVVAFACAFFTIKIEFGMRKKLPLRTERKRSSIEFEQSENIGQFFNLLFFIILILLKDFKPSETII